jgi:hypothetical protein
MWLPAKTSQRKERNHDDDKLTDTTVLLQSLKKSVGLAAAALLNFARQALSFP